MIAPEPAGEMERIRLLMECQILDTPRERAYDAVVELIAEVCDVPIAAISLIDECRQWFKAKIGLTVEQTPRDWAFCAHALLEPRRILIVEEATLDPRFADNPLVTGPPGIRFYAGFPLLSECGHALGTLCVIDSKSRSLSENQIRVLTALANYVSSMIAARVSAVRLRKSEAARQAAESHFALMVEHAPVMIWTRDADNRIDYVNDRVLKFFGKTKAEFLRTEWEDAIHPEDRIRVGEALRAVRKGVVFEAEARVRDANGCFRWLHFSGSPRPVVNGSYSGAIGSAIEVTERKRTQAELESAARMKSELLSNLSHEIHTPMNLLIGFCTLLRDTQLTAEQTDYVETIGKGVASLLSVINGGLDFSRLDAGTMEPDREDFRIDALAKDLVEFFSREARHKRLELSFSIGPEVPEWTCGDKGRLGQILTNLMGNALKFTDNGHVRLKVNVVGQNTRTRLIRFEVQDTGIGIAPEIQEPLFQAFRQGDGSMTRKYGGSGLGLAISERMAKLLGGGIGLESQLGAGARFWVEIPFEESTVLEPFSADSGLDLLGANVLVVEEVASSRDMIVRFLTSWMATVECAENGGQAIQMIRQKARSGYPYRVAFFGLSMPGITGIDVARLLALDPSYSDTSLILLTFPDEFGGGREWREAGVKSVLHRPVRKQLLRNAVERAIRPSMAFGRPSVSSR